MKKLIRLTENDIHNIIKESVERILNEISDDTIASARNKAFFKQKNTTSPYDRKKYARQLDTFSKEYYTRYDNANDVKKERMDRNAEKRDKGTRVYGKNPNSPKQSDKNQWYNKED